MMGLIATKKIVWEVRDDIGYLTLTDTPENRMGSLFFKELQTITTEIIPKSNISAIIISGARRHFSSGADLKDLLQTIKNEERKTGSQALLSNYNSFKYLSDLNIPVIAAIKGVCIGSALELAMHCHFRLCSPDAILGLPESTFGLIPGVGGIPKLLKLSGKAKTIELVLKGNTFNASDALKWNIVDAVYPKNELMGKAEQLARLASANYRKYNKTDYLRDI
jgi:enoyl-CoA hydratase/carnithine racemase